MENRSHVVSLEVDTRPKDSKGMSLENFCRKEKTQIGGNYGGNIMKNNLCCA